MIKCGLCGDEGFMPELEIADEGFECGAPGCNLAFGSNEFNADELGFGFHVIDPATEPGFYAFDDEAA